MQYDVGQRALLSTRNLRLKLPRKLQDSYIDLFVIIEHIGSTSYKSYLTKNSALRKIHPDFHMNLLRDFKDNVLKQQTPPIEVDGEKEFEVKAIVGHRVFRGQPQYMVLSFSYDAFENI